MEGKSGGWHPYTDLEDNNSTSDDANSAMGEYSKKPEPSFLQSPYTRKLRKFLAPIFIFINHALKISNLFSNTEAGEMGAELEGHLLPFQSDLERSGKKTNENGLEYQYLKNIWNIYLAIDSSGPGKFTWSFVKFIQDNLDSAIRNLLLIPESDDKKLIAIIGNLKDAQAELRLAMTIFDAEEINAVHRLVLRNKAILRCKGILQHVLRISSRNLDFAFDAAGDLRIPSTYPNKPAGDSTTDAPPPPEPPIPPKQ